ncbi:Trypanosomal VSG domain containing protein [Trypanosoma brucei equiperdum]|uniref:Trypanosomal VSG domain containing protein n=1 Tax=Trypanosoma brucei equiperdum TaxID=630700 RepID=A0A3L6L3A6_9TRYP|nr:Trypanosomal VSG domain containing protein [Trypanosoma brucei equiperdum]
MQITRVILYFLAFYNARSAAPWNAKTNVAVGHAACAILQLADIKLTQGPAPLDDGGALDTLLALNMFLSSNEWKAKFIKEKGEEVAWTDKENTDKAANKHWEESWPLWTKARQNVKQGQPIAQTIDKSLFKGLDDTA